MADAARLYTPAEAGAVSGLALKAVHNAIDKRIVEPVAKTATRVVKPAKPTNPGAHGPRRMLTGEDLVRLRLWYGVGAVLPAERRQRLFREMAAKPAAKTLKADELLIVDVGAARKQVAERVRDLESAEKAIHRDKAIMGGEPVFRGTRIPAYGVAAMLAAGADETELLEGYPKLDRRKLELAKIWATAHPRRGRPKRLSDYGLTLTSVKRILLKSDPLVGKARSVSAGER